jgi:predicted metal-dependent hydrolase
MDYVILHELMHTRIRNHSLRFWKALGKLIENPKKIDRELNQYDFLLAL